jgi:DNA polymerase-3 subunit alpha
MEQGKVRRGASLHNHTYFSLLDAVMSPAELVQQAYDLGFKAVAITEHGNMHSYVEGYKKAKELGIKFIPGCEVYEVDDMYDKSPEQKRYHLILLAKSEKGLKNLFQIVTAGHLEGFYMKPRVDLKLMAKYSEDIICMSSCLGGRINRILGTTVPTKAQFEEAKKWVAKYKEVFGDNYFLEMQSHNTLAQQVANRNLLLLSKETGVEYTITFDTHIRDGSDLQKDIHAKFLLIGQDREVGETYEGCWQQSIEEIHETMDKQIGYEAVEHGIDMMEKIADMCNVEIQLNQSLMPHIQIPKEFKDDREYLKHLITEGWKKRGIDKLPKEQRKKYKERVRNEFEVIDYLDFCSYFIMLYQLMEKFRERKIPLGYGRGSAGGCLILYLLGVTEIDSIRWDLDFSRFANKGRKGSPADVDIDISKRRRQEALEVAIELFGRDHIAQLATFNSLSPKVAIRDLGKVFHEQGIYDIPYDVRDKIAKLVPDDPNEKMTIERALESSTELQKYAEKYPLLFEYTKYLQNLPKSVGTHAAAVIIAPEPITNYSPLMRNGDGNVMLQLEMHSAMEDLGLVKMDFLGLRTLDVVDDTLKLAGLTWDDIDLKHLNLEDKDVYMDIYGKGNTLGVFQMEAYVPQKMYEEMYPDITIEDVFAVNAMNRPAILSVGMDRVYMKGKKDPSSITYIHPDTEPIFRNTNGIMLYQEQALKVFALAGFDESEQDTARRAIGKKKADVMAQLYDKFQGGLRKRGWTDEQIEEMWKLVEAQSGYSFNRSHCVEYGLLSYVTAYLKKHYPIEFMTALLISENGNYEKLSKYIQATRDMGIQVLPPDINHSGKDFTIHNNTIVFGLGSIKGVGENAVEKIIEERKNGKFKDLKDFVERTQLDKATNVALIQSGAFGENKLELLEELFDLLHPKKPFVPVEKVPTKRKLMELGLIKNEEEYKDKERCLLLYNEWKKKNHDLEQEAKRLKQKREFEVKYMMNPEMFEYNTLSIFLSGHPFQGYEEVFKDVSDMEDGVKVVLGGTITNIKYKKQRDGRRMADIDVLTLHGLIECRAFATTYTTYQDFFKKGYNVVILAKKSGSQFLVDKMKLLEQWKAEYEKRLERKRQAK